MDPAIEIRSSLKKIQMIFSNHLQSRTPGGRMSLQAAPFFVRSKIWIENDQGKVVFGLGRYRILDTVRRTGSLHAAAKELKMSYRAVWMRIHTSERCLGRALVARQGNGSRLTPFAEKLMMQFDRLLHRVQRESDAVYESLMSETFK
jgi:molybdate transport system regulatory protein